MSELPRTPKPAGLITSHQSQPLSEHPVAVYLAGLSASSRRTMASALDKVAQLGLGNAIATAWDVPWERLRFQGTTAIRSALQEQYAHTTTSRILSALRGVLQAAWKLGLMSAEDYQKAASVESVRGETVPAGELAGVSNLSPHDFRRTFVGDLLDAGADIVTVQKMAGHAHPATTSRYDRRDKRAQHKAASLLHVPYARRVLEPDASKPG